jgi:opacity protein-like surface antigen
MVMSLPFGRILAACLLGAVLVAGGARQAAAQPSAAAWQFQVTPYIWLPRISGTFSFTGAGGSPQVDVGVGADDYLQNLDMALMLGGEARKGRWAIFTDFIYLDFSGENAAVRSVTGPGGIVQVSANANTTAGLKGLVWELAAAYTISHTDAATFEVLGGFRYLGLEAKVDWQLASSISLFPQSGSFSQKEDLLDAIVGVRGKARLGGGNWFIPYYLDIGTGSSQFTWQGMAGISYAFKWGDLLLAYRHLYYDMKDGKLLQDTSFSGPALGASFRF